MKNLPFLNRSKEKQRLQSFIQGQTGSLAVVYGRRRCGKSRLLQQILTKDSIYFLSDQSEQALQRTYLAEAVSSRIAGFNESQYPTWKALFTAFNRQAPTNTTLIIDEFPYLVQSASDLPSVLQNLIDGSPHFNIILCGSSQKMMQGAVLDKNAPLYGRAVEIIKVTPLQAGWVQKAFGKDALSSMESYAVWGGIPRYWELARMYPNHEKAVKNIVFDRNGALHNEPKSLLQDDMRSSVQPHSLLSIIATGSHKLSEIAGRAGKPAVNLSRPLENLIDLGLVKRELPWGENIKSTKRTLYKIKEPFILYWYRFILPHFSLLELDLVEEVYQQCKPYFAHHYSEIWESMARDSLPKTKPYNIQWKPGSRWWGTGLDKTMMEIDIVAESFDGKFLLLGEAKWKKKINIEEIVSRLEYYKNNIPFAKKREIKCAIWIPQIGKNHKCKYPLIDSKKVLGSFCF